MSRWLGSQRAMIARIRHGREQGWGRAISVVRTRVIPRPCSTRCSTWRNSGRVATRISRAGYRTGSGGCGDGQHARECGGHSQEHARTYSDDWIEGNDMPMRDARKQGLDCGSRRRRCLALISRHGLCRVAKIKPRRECHARFGSPLCMTQSASRHPKTDDDRARLSIFTPDAVQLGDVMSTVCRSDRCRADAGWRCSFVACRSRRPGPDRESNPKCPAGDVEASGDHALRRSE
jgi:hypothetical protein